ncbi:hypothetical protein B0H14DRAFT_3502077 [Mycena olivaceomarginata]|nr:hypothetical protein B0H14DRAFT_3502077 [Mycena olivaceomarginata]
MAASSDTSRSDSAPIDFNALGDLSDADFFACLDTINSMPMLAVPQTETDDTFGFFGNGFAYGLIPDASFDIQTDDFTGTTLSLPTLPLPPASPPVTATASTESTGDGNRKRKRKNEVDAENIICCKHDFEFYRRADAPRREKFDGTGYSGFKTKIKALAKARGLGGYIDGTITRPDAPAAGTAAQTTALPPDPTSIYSLTPSFDEWTHRDAMGVAMLVLNVKNPVGLGLKTDGTATEAMQSLEDNHNKVTDMGLVNALRDLHNAYLVPGTPMPEHVSRLRNLWQVANDMGAKIEDSGFRSIFISLPGEEWDNVVPILFTFPTRHAESSVARHQGLGGVRLAGRCQSLVEARGGLAAQWINRCGRNFPAPAQGFAFGGGRRTVGNIKALSPTNQAAMDELLEDESVRRMATYPHKEHFFAAL